MSEADWNYGEALRLEYDMLLSFLIGTLGMSESAANRYIYEQETKS